MQPLTTTPIGTLTQIGSQNTHLAGKPVLQGPFLQQIIHCVFFWGGCPLSYNAMMATCPNSEHVVYLNIIHFVLE